jgi:cytidylate kinase
MASIVINQQLGSRGVELGQLTARHLGYRFIARCDVVAEASRAYDVAPDQFLIIDERQPHFWERPKVDTDRLIAFLRAVLLKAMAADRVVIVGSVPAHNMPECGCGLRVRVMASPAARAERVAAEEGLSVAAAEKRVRDHDREVRARAQTLLAVNIDDPVLYHLVINTSTLEIEPLAATLAGCAREVDARASERGRRQLCDASLVAQVRAALLVHPKFGRADVEIRCDGGVVRLNAPCLVAPWDEMAHRVVGSVEGVKSVEIGTHSPPLPYRAD